MTTKRGRIILLSPVPSSDVSGSVRIEFALDTPGGTVRAEAAGFQGDGLSLLTVAEAETGPDGRGSFLFPADEYPHGPLTLLLSTVGDEDRDVLHLSLFNLSGKPYRESIADFGDPPLAREKGLRLLFADDFDVDVIGQDGNVVAAPAAAPAPAVPAAAEADAGEFVDDVPF